MLVLMGLGYDSSTLIYIAAGEIYGGEQRMVKLHAAFPNLVSVLMATANASPAALR